MIRASLLNRYLWDKIAVIEDERQLSYGQLAEKIMAIQQELPRGKRENIAIFLPNSGNYMAALFGIIMSGMTAFPLSIRLTAHEIIPLLEQTSAYAVITSKEYMELFEYVAKTISIKIIYIEDLQEADNSKLHATESVNIDEPMVLLTTSGTTGTAKIVQLSEKNVTTSTLAYIDKMDFEKFNENEIRFTLGTPFSSVYGLMILTACAIKLFTIVIIKEAFTLDVLYKTVERHKVTHFEGGVSVGLLMNQMAGRPIPYDITSLRYAGLAGSKLPTDVLINLMKAYHRIEFWTGYGMTEAGPLIAKPDKKVNINKLDSVGTKSLGLSIMIYINGVLSNVPYEEGEIVVKGESVMQGYYKNQEATQKILKDGYLYTGDIGYLDEDGYLYICGRKKNVIIVRGFNVYAEEIEECILNSGLAKDCYVYGETDSLGNEIVCANIIPMSLQLEAETVRSYCKEHLASYKLPQKIRMIEEIKKTATGKTERI